MTLVYRILGFIINLAAIVLSISLLGSIKVMLSSPQTIISGCMMLAVILYTWASFSFKRTVLQQQEVVNRSLLDWIRVNGIITLIFSTISFLGILPLLVNIQPLMEAIKTYGVAIPEKSIVAFMYVMLLYSIILFIHILWTFALTKKNRAFFQ